jgi:hypothetical protein
VQIVLALPLMRTGHALNRGCDVAWKQTTANSTPSSLSPGNRTQLSLNFGFLHPVACVRSGDGGFIRLRNAPSRCVHG